MRRLPWGWLVLAAVMAAVPASAQNYGMRRSVIGSGGGSSGGVAKGLTSTIGQTAIGAAFGTTHVICGGFWCRPDGAVSPVTWPPAVAATGQSRLRQNVPNPFNPSTRVFFVLGTPVDVRLGVFDLRGREVRRLADGPLSAGEHGITWDGCDGAGRLLASGTYLLRLQAGPESMSAKMTLLR